jgi:cation diffusion facilitator CzcD-associated flavoprotein CzcO
MLNYHGRDGTTLKIELEFRAKGATSRLAPPPSTRNSWQPRILIIGAGMSGILATIKLRQAGFDNIQVIEKKQAPGGTWRDNTYPGLKCDVPAHMFTYSFAPNPNYSTRFPKGSEINQYLNRVCHDYHVDQHIRFNTTIDSLHYEDGFWYSVDNHAEIHQYDVVICATGILHNPYIPSITGLESFKGSYWHTARWNHQVALKGKRIAIIGSGATAAQVVPELVQGCEHLTLFQRTPQWIFPMPNKVYSALEMERLRHSPRLASKLRHRYSKVFQYTFTRAVIGNRLLQSLIEAMCRLHLKRKVKDPVLRAKLTPNFRAGCKRLIFGKGFYQALQQPNASLETAPISSIQPDGIQTADGRLHACDVIVFATGFQAHDYMRPMQVTGKDSQHLDQVWEQGAFCHRSTSIPGFPNFFMMFGPYSPIGNYSAISVAEVQIDYITKQLHELERSGHDLIEPRSDCTHRLTQQMRKAMRHTVWSSGCQSWYQDQHGQTPMWPWTFERYEREMAKVQLSEFRMSKRPSRPTITEPSIECVQKEFATKGFSVEQRQPAIQSVAKGD